MGWGTVWPVLVGFGLLVWLWTLNLVCRWRCRHLPGPRPSWLSGNILDFGQGRATEALQKWAQKYGPVFVWYMGRKPCIVLSDPDLIRQAAVNRFPSLHDRSMFPIIPGTLIEANFIRTGLFTSEGKAWANLRALLQQFFTETELAKHSRKMNLAANKLVALLERASIDGTEFEATDTFSRMTLEVIGTSAFGVDFQIQKTDDQNLKIESPVSSSSSSSPPNPPHHFSDLLSATKCVFRPIGIRGNRARIALGFSPLLSWLQRRGVAIGGRIEALRNISLARCYIWGLLQAILEKHSSSSSLKSTATGSTANRKAFKSGTKKTRDIFNEVEERKSQQCPMRHLGKTRAKCFANGKMSLSTLIQESAPLFRLLRNEVDPQTRKPLSDTEICAQSFNMILAGYETTALGLSYALYELAKRPEMQRQIAQEVAALRALQNQNQKEPADVRNSSESLEISFSDLKQLPFTEAAFLEGLRLWPPVSPIIPLTRHAKEEVYLDNYRVPKGANVMFNVWHVHHNPKYYPNPDVFRPERFLPGHPEMKSRHHYSYFPFGAGPRQCIGKVFAVAETVITLAKLIEKYEFRVENTRSATLDVRTTVTLQPVNGIWLKVSKREEN